MAVRGYLTHLSGCHSFNANKSAVIRLFVRCCSSKPNLLNETNYERERKIARIKLEMEMQRQSGNYFVPDVLSDLQWKELLQLDSIHHRIKYYRYVKKTSLNKEKQKRYSIRKSQVYREYLSNLNDAEHIQYGLGKNSMFSKIPSTSLVKIYHGNLVHALTFGQDLVIDFSFNDVMNSEEWKTSFFQTSLLYSHVKRDREPFRLHFCNVADDATTNKLKLTLPFLQQSEPLVNLTEKSYMDMFPRERLVYLVPKCDVDLEYNPNDVYIVGCFVDLQGQGPFTLAKARRDGIRVAQFPLDKYLSWKCGKKELTLDQTVKILITLKNTNDWCKALSHVPRRKLMDEVRSRKRHG